MALTFGRQTRPADRRKGEGRETNINTWQLLRLKAMLSRPCFHLPLALYVANGRPEGKDRSLLSGNDMESPAALRMWTLWALAFRKDFSLKVAGAQVGTSQVECDWEGQRKKKTKIKQQKLSQRQNTVKAPNWRCA